MQATIEQDAHSLPIGNGMEPVATDVQTAVMPDTGHWVAERAPEAMLDLITGFLASPRAAA